MYDKYRSDMDRIEASPELKRRVLDTLDAMDGKEAAPAKIPSGFRSRQRPLLVAASLLVVLGLSFFARGLLSGGPGGGPVDDGMAILEENSVDLHATEEDAMESLAFDALRPTYLPPGYVSTKNTTVNKSLITLEYKNHQGHRLVLRMAPGTSDISGIHEPFQKEVRNPFGDGTLLLRMKEGMVHVALWTLEESVVSLYVETGLPEAEVVKILQGLTF